MTSAATAFAPREKILQVAIVTAIAAMESVKSHRRLARGLAQIQAMLWVVHHRENVFKIVHAAVQGLLVPRQPIFGVNAQLLQVGRVPEEEPPINILIRHLVVLRQLKQAAMDIMDPVIKRAAGRHQADAHRVLIG